MTTYTLKALAFSEVLLRFLLDRYEPHYENFVLVVRSHEPYKTSRNVQVAPGKVGKREWGTDPFWLLAPDSWLPYPAAF